MGMGEMNGKGSLTDKQSMDHPCQIPWKSSCNAVATNSALLILAWSGVNDIHCKWAMVWFTARQYWSILTLLKPLHLSLCIYSEWHQVPGLKHSCPHIFMKASTSRKPCCHQRCDWRHQIYSLIFGWYIHNILITCKCIFSVPKCCLSAVVVMQNRNLQGGGNMMVSLEAVSRGWGKIFCRTSLVLWLE